MLRQIKLKLSQLRLESEIEGNYTDAPAWSTTIQPQSVTRITNMNNNHNPESIRKSKVVPFCTPINYQEFPNFFQY